MSRRPNTVPTVPLNTVLPLDVYTRLTSQLYSDLEGRVPHGAYSKFLTELIRAAFSEKSLDLAPWLGSAAGALQVRGTPEAITHLKELLK